MARKDRYDAVERDLDSYKDKNDLANLDFVGEQDLRRAERQGRLAASDSALTQALLAAVAAFVVALLLCQGVSATVADLAVKGREGEVPDYVGYSLADGLFYEYYEVDPDQQVVSGPYADSAEVPEPAWHADALAKAREALPGDGLPALVSVAASLAVAAVVYLVVWQMRFASPYSGDLANVLLNDNDQDMHMRTPAELNERYRWAADAGASVPYECSALMSHAFLNNHGVRPVEVARRHEADDVEADIVAGMVVEDEEGNLLTRQVPMIDESIAPEVFDKHRIGGRSRKSALADRVEKLPDFFLTRTVLRALKGPGVDESVRRIVDPSVVECVDGGTLAEEINEKWVMDPREPQRPAGAYRVNTEDNHVIIVASTRTGKTQNYILPFLDVVRRQDKKPNLIVADMKGQILKALYAPLEYSGYDVRQFNFFNPLHSDVVNCLQTCAEFMADGQSGQATSTMTRITQCFFPKGKGDDAFWNDAATNCYEMNAWMLVDIVNRRDDRIRRREHSGEVTASRAASLVDENWATLSFRNVYRLFRAMAGERVLSPAAAYADYAAQLRARADRLETDALERAPEGEAPDPDALAEAARLRAMAQTAEATGENDPCQVFWDGEESLDMLTVYANALLSLPQNKVREQIGSAHASLASMKSSEKTVASIYGVASTQMRQFDDDNLARLTSGRKSQNLDIYSMSFQHRVSLRFDGVYATTRHIKGRLCRFEAFSDKGLTRPMGPDYGHEQEVDENGWVSYVWEGTMPDEEVYVRCKILDANKLQEVAEPVYFSFKKARRTRAQGRIYVKTQFTDEYVVEGGTVCEMVMAERADGTRSLVKGRSTHRQKTFDADLALAHWDEEKEKDEFEGAEDPYAARTVKAAISVRKVPRVTETKVSYCERPKAVFFMVDLTKTQYLSILLIYLHQQFDANVGESYVTKPNQKPQTATLYVLDEAGNLKSGNNGIPDLATKFSLGLEQRQQFTLVFQTYEQLKTAYAGQEATVKSNALVEVFLGSKENDYLKEVSERSGTKHEVHATSLTETHDPSKAVGKVKSEHTVQKSVVETNVVSVNALRTMERGQALIYDRDGYPIFNKLDQMMPPDWGIRPKKISDPYREYTPTTLPSSAGISDVSGEEFTDFFEEFDQLLWVASYAQEAESAYRAYMGFDVADYKTRLERDRDQVARDVCALAQMMVDRRRAELKERGLDLPRYSRRRLDDIDFKEQEASADRTREAYEAKVAVPGNGAPDLMASHIATLTADGPGSLRPDIDRDVASALVAAIDYPDVQRAVGARRVGDEVRVGAHTLLRKRDDPEDTASECPDPVARQVQEANDLYVLCDGVCDWLLGPDAPTGAAMDRFAERLGRYFEALRPAVLGYAGPEGEEDDDGYADGEGYGEGDDA